jgi:hypothetical protein
VSEDEAIGRAAERLMMWGFSSNQVYKAIAKLSGNSVRELKWPRIEAIHKEWQQVPLDLRRDHLVRARRSIYRKDSLVKQIPLAADGRCRRTLSDLAGELLGNGGRMISGPMDWIVQPMTAGEIDAEEISEIQRPFYAAGFPRAGFIDDSCAELTPAAEARTLWFVPREENGVEK